MGDIFQLVYCITMKYYILFVTLFSLALAQVSKRSVVDALNENGQDGCLACVDDIVNAVDDCQDENVDLLVCITEAIGAFSDCTNCICEILQTIIDDVSDICP